MIVKSYLKMWLREALDLPAGKLLLQELWYTFAFLAFTFYTETINLTILAVRKITSVNEFTHTLTTLKIRITIFEITFRPSKCRGVIYRRLKEFLSQRFQRRMQPHPNLKSFRYRSGQATSQTKDQYHRQRLMCPNVKRRRRHLL